MDDIFYKKSILSGALIAVGDIALMQVESKYLGALLFSLALLSIIQLGLPLYTGRIGAVIHKHNYKEMTVMLLMNVIGACAIISFYMLMNGESAIGNVADVSNVKFEKDYLTLFIAGIMCNILIHIAVTCKNTVITILCIMCFILCGFEHSIADVGYAVFGANFISYIPKWIVVLLGNTVGGIVTEICLSD